MCYMCYTGGEGDRPYGRGRGWGWGGRWVCGGRGEEGVKEQPTRWGLKSRLVLDGYTENRTYGVSRMGGGKGRGGEGGEGGSMGLLR